jgi:NAD(P)H-dependent FMN reductase
MARKSMLRIGELSMLNILGVSGSMSENSSSLKVVELAMEAAQRHGAGTRVLDLRETDLPMFRSHSEHGGHQGRDFANEQVNWADAFLLVTPDYHGSMSGAMKNFLDHYWSEFSGKLFAYGCVSLEKGLTVMDQMRTAIRQCYGWSLPYGLPINPDEDIDADGIALNQSFEKRLLMTARDLTVYGTLLRDQFQQDLRSDEDSTFAARYR